MHRRSMHRGRKTSPHHLCEIWEGEGKKAASTIDVFEDLASVLASESNTISLVHMMTKECGQQIWTE
jgi:hypothetical protein